MQTSESAANPHIDRALAALNAVKGALPAGTSPAILGAPAQAVWEFHYAEAIALRARWKGTGALPLLPEIAEHVEAAVKAAPAYDDAAPLRLLGMLLIKAPSWPNGPGDTERGYKMLEDAVRTSPQRSEGHVHHADSLLDQSRVQEAQRELKRGRELTGANPRAIKLANEVEQRVKSNKGVKSY